jgi:acetophenone carboxylase
VLERDPEHVLKDLREGKVTHWAARNLYRVAYNEETLRLDPEETESLRIEARRKRLERAKPFDAFEAEWREQRPPDEALTCYGAYPHPSEGPPPGPPGM